MKHPRVPSLRADSGPASLSLGRAAPMPTAPATVQTFLVGPTTPAASVAGSLSHGLASRDDSDGKAMPTIDTFREYISYNPDTGDFIWKKRASKRAIVGRKAGGFNKQGYLAIMLKGKTVQAHRIAFALMTGKWPEHQIDHINGDRSDNRWANLREAD